jgi:hypothetical protein
MVKKDSECNLIRIDKPMLGANTQLKEEIL